jgi:phosphoribosylformimino-5-aminoimidazole carboxamide ribotide isomerase
MIVIPAIDIRDGKVVRLAQGKFSEQTTYSASPVEMAKRWACCGAEMIHIVDLDGAALGIPQNLALVRQIADAVDVKLELGGGIRSEDSICKAIEAGVSKVVIGTRALDEKFLGDAVKKYGDRLVVGVDASDGLVVTKGWVHKTTMSAIEFANKVESMGVKTINYTDISKDGMLEGPNIESLNELLDATGIDVVLAGGISSIEDMKRLISLKAKRLKGVIVGKALYEGRLDLAEAIKACKE